MASTAWVRTVQTSYDLPQGNLLMASLAAGQSIMRIRFGWGFHATTGFDTDLHFLAENLVVWGMVTTIGNGSETVPDPRTNPGDADPPTQRWLWWESRRPVLQASMPNVAIWSDSGPQEPCDAHGQVLATGIPAGDTLNLWASWAMGYDWDPGPAFIWFGASILVKTS